MGEGFGDDEVRDGGGGGGEWVWDGEVVDGGWRESLGLTEMGIVSVT